MRYAAFDPNARVMTDAEVQAWHANRAAARASRAALRATGPAARIRALTVGASVLFTEYRTTPQVSSSVNQIQARTGQRYTSAIARDLLTGETVIGVRVTRTV